jgi:hypothetical protein
VAAIGAARLIWLKYPPAGNGWIPGATMTFFVSLMIAVGGTMLGEVWCGIAESYRIGNSHMSYVLNGFGGQDTKRSYWRAH